MPSVTSATIIMVASTGFAIERSLRNMPRSRGALPLAPESPARGVSGALISALLSRHDHVLAGHQAFDRAGHHGIALGETGQDLGAVLRLVQHARRHRAP